MTDREILNKYLGSIRAFTAGEQSASDFSVQYLREFKREEGEMSEETYQILQTLFGEADAYCEDADLRDERDIDEKELLEAAVEASQQIERRLEQRHTDR